MAIRAPKAEGVGSRGEDRRREAAGVPDSELGKRTCAIAEAEGIVVCCCGLAAARLPLQGCAARTRAKSL